ncbi:type IX secretion system motor protein PorM/GldM [Parvicella tangerina]|uniref:Gliding motility protein GldM n=1 Tax=Parvicella tangerina TaxID=2829795 RepID=A0A916JPL4_9FLAO|nr:GldM family protein [Parvicella tangerina]CAG5084396.1 hypothetical protein CRYO30217_02455 [Parvicella tangerina]
MAGGKETPRQKMIGLMYLVLMAMLAMNVSKEVINAFVTLNNNIDGANRDMIYANGQLIDDMAAKAKNPELGDKERAEAEMWYQRGLDVHSMCRRTSNFFMNEANAMLAEGQPGEWVEDRGDGFLSIIDLNDHEHPYEKKDDYDVPTRLFVGDNHKKINDRGVALKETLENYRDSLCILIGDKVKEDGTGSYSFTPPEGLVKENNEDTTWLEALQPALESVKPEDQAAIKEIYRILTVPEMVHNHGEEYPWQAGQFDHAPMAAAAAIFTGIKSKVIQAEKVALANFGEQSQAPPFKFNKIEPLSFANTAYINQGDSLNMRVMIAAYDSTAATEIRYWVDDSTYSEENMIESSKNDVTLAGGVGDHFVYGQIAVETKSGKEWKSFKPFKYSVGSPNAAVSAYDLKVLYKGWNNRIQVAAGGFPPEAVKVSGSGCSIKKEGEFYIAKPTVGVGSAATITVSATADDGSTVQLTKEEFRVYPLPKPTPQFGGKGIESSSISTVVARQGPPIFADLSGSPLDIKYTVSSFEMIVVKGGKVGKLKSNSNQMTGEMKAALKTMNKGSSLTFSNIRAKGPNGEVPIGALGFVLN